MSDDWKKELRALGADATLTESFEILAEAVDEHLLAAVREIGGSLGGNGPRLDVMLSELAMAIAYAGDLRGAAIKIAKSVTTSDVQEFPPRAGEYSGPAPEKDTAPSEGMGDSPTPFNGLPGVSETRPPFRQVGFVLEVLEEAQKPLLRALKGSGLNDLEMGHDIDVSHELTATLALLFEAEGLVKAMKPKGGQS